MSDNVRKDSLMDRVWSFFTSLRLAIALIIIMAVASIIGTIIEQNQPIEKYRQIYTDGTIRLLDALNIFDMYHAWWFLLLLVLFTVNLACCTIDRFPRALRVVRNPKTTLDEGLEKSLSQVERWRKKGSVEQWRDAYRDALAKGFAPPRVTENSGTWHLYAESGVVSRFGVYVTHVSIVIIFIGAIIGNVVGFKGFANIVEGQTVDEIPVRGGRDKMPLGFSVRCNKFWVEYYPSGQPKKYASDLSVIDGGREVLRKTIEVNDPLRYKGVWFYQSSYGSAGAATAELHVSRTGGEHVGDLSLAAGQAVQVPGYGVLTGLDYQQNYQGMGPALLVRLEKPGGKASEFWLPQMQPGADARRGDPFFFSFGGLKEMFYTGLQVAHDPGVNVVWAGCALMVIGILIAFFLSHQRVWVRVAAGPEGKVDVVLAGTTSRNRLAFERKFEKIQADLKAVGS